MLKNQRLKNIFFNLKHVLIYLRHIQKMFELFSEMRLFASLRMFFNASLTLFPVPIRHTNTPIAKSKKKRKRHRKKIGRGNL
jgi:hypothetical protein